MTTNARYLVILAGLLACGKDKPESARSAASFPAGDSTAYTSGAAASTPGTLPAGTILMASVQQTLSSDRNAIGERVRAVVTQNVVGANREVVIPVGSSVVFTIALLGPAPAGGTADGTLALNLSNITVGKMKYSPSASVGPVPHTLIGKSGARGRDVVVTPGAPIAITLTEPLKISAN